MVRPQDAVGSAPVDARARLCKVPTAFIKVDPNVGGEEKTAGMMAMCIPTVMQDMIQLEDAASFRYLVVTDGQLHLVHQGTGEVGEDKVAGGPGLLPRLLLGRTYSESGGTV
ncbi:hypothetical protein WJX77_007952 [Trebouxia sp. C0004]